MACKNDESKKTSSMAKSHPLVKKVEEGVHAARKIVAHLKSKGLGKAKKTKAKKSKAKKSKRR